MNKKIALITFVVAAFSFAACNSLDITNTSTYDANLVWSDANLANAYVTSIYPTVFGNWSAGADNNSEQINGIPLAANTITLTGSSYKVWEYSTIRRINEGIKYLGESEDLSTDVKNDLTSQLLFMRAYEYMKMIIYHGGVPYITEPQDKDTDDLYVTRTSTKECFEKVIADIDEACKYLPVKVGAGSADYGRIDQVFAKAYKAKVLLYKASPQFNPSKPYTNAYWADAYAAAKEAYDLAVAKGSALTDSYDDIWLVEQGPEVIFAVVNQYPGKTAYWDDGTRPGTVSRNSAAYMPTWEMVKAFPMRDGKAWDDASGIYYVGDENAFMQRYWENRDPRFASSITWNGREYPVAGKPSDYRQYTGLGIAKSDDSFGYNQNAGVTGTHNDSFTGFYIRKIQDLSLLQTQVESAYDVDFLLMRFAELMFIYAEAANENGHSDVAVDMLKQIRERAGIEPGADGLYGLKVGNREEIRQAILDERNIELCFEGHRFLDLRRTRHLDILDGHVKHGIESIAVNPDGSDMDITAAYNLATTFKLTPENFRYVCWQVPMVGEDRLVVKDTYYFFPIQQVRIDANKNLEQNNNWGGTFNPTME